MNRWKHLGTGVVVAALALLASAAFAQDPGRSSNATGQNSASHGPVSVRVTGGTTWTTPEGLLRRFTFTGAQYMDGSVDGEWQLVAGATILHGDVICLSLVDPHHVRLGGRVDFAAFTQFFPEGTEIGWTASDLGEGSGSSGDQTTNLRAFRNAPPGSAGIYCSTGIVPGGGTVGLDPIDTGNIQIHLNP
jgi:hypothetical protein